MLLFSFRYFKQYYDVATVTNYISLLVGLIRIGYSYLYINTSQNEQIIKPVFFIPGYKQDLFISKLWLILQDSCSSWWLQQFW
jgi:hypothetical protein